MVRFSNSYDSASPIEKGKKSDVTMIYGSWRFTSIKYLQEILNGSFDLSVFIDYSMIII